MKITNTRSINVVGEQIEAGVLRTLLAGTEDSAKVSVRITPGDRMGERTIMRISVTVEEELTDPK